jgi:hypothetical protein
MKKPSSFWKDSLNSMHPSVRVRYIRYFAMAETMDRSFDAVLDLWRGANEATLQAVRAALR